MREFWGMKEEIADENFLVFKVLLNVFFHVLK